MIKYYYLPTDELQDDEVYKWQNGKFYKLYINIRSKADVPDDVLSYVTNIISGSRNYQCAWNSVDPNFWNILSKKEYTDLGVLLNVIIEEQDDLLAIALLQAEI